MNDYDFSGDMRPWQDQLDAAGVNFDVTSLAGCTYSEIDNYVNRLIAAAYMRENING